MGSIPELNGNKIGRTILKNCNLVIVWWPRGACLLNVTNLVRNPYTFYDFFKKVQKTIFVRVIAPPPRVCILMKSRTSKKKETWLGLLCLVEGSKLERFTCFIQVNNMFMFDIVYCTRRYGVYILCDSLDAKYTLWNMSLKTHKQPHPKRNQQ